MESRFKKELREGQEIQGQVNTYKQPVRFHKYIFKGNAIINKQTSIKIEYYLN